MGLHLSLGITVHERPRVWLISGLADPCLLLCPQMPRVRSCIGKLALGKYFLCWYLDALGMLASESEFLSPQVQGIIGPQEVHINIRTLENMISGIPLISGLGTRI